MSANHDARPTADDLVERVRAIDDPFAQLLLHRLASVGDLSSGSDEIESLCTDWTIGYHLSSVRANVLRTLPLAARSRVLELGSAGGAVTRHLGETFASVDAVEPDAGLAAVASMRCHDLPTVTVHHGWLGDVDTQEDYDVIVALDVLGELDRRGDDLAALLDWCRSHLAPQGVLVIGADNEDGVRALAGSATPRRRPDDTHRSPRIGRDRLTSLIGLTGLVPAVLSAFPDHRTARVLIDHAALEAIDRQLLSALPSFPSPPYDGEPGSPHEGTLWSSAIADGTADRSANSFVVVASSTEVRTPAATYWSQGRRAALSATNTIEAGPDHGIVRRTRTFPDAPDAEGPLRHRPHVESLLHGRPLPLLLSQTDDLATAAALLRSWASMVASATAVDSPVPWDLIPRNVIVLPDGELAAFDQEWEHEPSPRATDLVLERGAFWLAYDLLVTHGRPAWLRGETVGASADVVLRLVRPSTPAGWLESFAHDESTSMSYIWPPPHGKNRTFTARREWKNVTSLSNSPTPPQTGSAGSTDAVDLHEVVDSLSQANADLRAENQALKLELRHTALLHRDDTMGLVASSEALKDRLERSLARNRRQKARITVLQSQLKALKESRTWRVGRAVLRPLSKISRAAGR